MGCVQSVLGKNNFVVLFEDGQKKDIGSCSLVYLSEKEEVEMEESITLFPEIEEGVPTSIQTRRKKRSIHTRRQKTRRQRYANSTFE